MITVRVAERADQVRLVEFIRDHWSATHIFTERPDLFAWQYLQSDGRLNMMLAEDDGPERRVLGVLGFIPMGRFAPELGDRDLMLAIWKVRDDGAPPGLGLRMLKMLQRELSPRLIAAIGTSEMVRPIYEVLGYQVGALRQSAIFHPGRAGQLRVASGAPNAAFEAADPVSTDTLELLAVGESAPRELRDAVDRFAAAATPAKSWEYIRERYLQHPWYRYDVRVVQRHGEPVAVVVWRAVDAPGGRVLRIVDIVGDVEWLEHARFALQREVIEHDAEYIDLMQCGIDDSILQAAGFVGVDTDPGLMLPNYFSPFEARNIVIELAYKVLDGSDSPVRLYRADSDQDRPNLAADLADGPASP